MSEALTDLARLTGVATGYRDQLGREREAPPDTLRAVLAALEYEVATDAEAEATFAALRAGREARDLPRWLVSPAGQYRPGLPAWSVEREDGSVVEGGMADAVPLDRSTC